MTRPTATRDYWDRMTDMTPLLLGILAIGLVVAAMGFAYGQGHDAGYEAGQRDLCGEMGGTHVVEDADYSWCDR